VNNPAFYSNILYPYQDRILHVLRTIDTDFYLTGGTAASRVYLHHRFSDDLDLFVNDNDSFGLWVGRVIQGLLLHREWQIQVLLKEQRFVGLNRPR
jgi:predicted nucleotidyltransferase component of viral defense system